MKVALIHSVSGESALELKGYLEHYGHKVTIYQPFKDGRSDFTGYDYVISLGCSAETFGMKKRLNKPIPVQKCVDKRLTFAIFNRAEVSTVDWRTEYKDIPKNWEQVVVRKSATGRKAEDLEYYWCDKDIPKNAALYTEVFYGRYEYRIVVVAGKVVGRYYKNNLNGEWIFKHQPAQGFEKMDEHCERAAQALKIDYVGFDVLAKNKNDFVLLEANSGAIMTYEAGIALCEIINQGI